LAKVGTTISAPIPATAITFNKNNTTYTRLGAIQQSGTIKLLDLLPLDESALVNLAFSEFIEAMDAVGKTLTSAQRDSALVKITGILSAIFLVANAIQDNVDLYNYTEEPYAYALTVSKAGTGNGVVTSNPSGIDGFGTASFATGISVALTASSQAGSTFAGWSGAATGTGTATIAMDSNKEVIASFNLLPPPDPTYSFSTTPTFINEGSSGTFTVQTSNVANGTTLYWTIPTNANDFTDTYGTFIVNANTGSFNVNPIADADTEGNELFTVAVRLTSTIGNIVATSAPVRIGDRSTAPEAATFALVRSAASVFEGNSFTVTFTTNRTGSFPYTITGVSTADIGSVALSGVLTNGQVVTFTTTDDGLVGAKTFAISLDNGQASTFVTINDNFLAAGTTISEGCVPGTTTYRVVKANGTGGTFNVDTINSLQCGYVALPIVPVTIVAAGNRVTVVNYNALTESVNELFGDTHNVAGPAVGLQAQSDLRWGWGGENVAAIAKGNKISALHTNELVNRINASTLRTNSTDQELVIITPGDKITAEFFNTAATLLNSARTVRNEVDPGLTTISNIETFVYSTQWNHQLENVVQLNFGGYNSARHFFNAGGDIRIAYSITNGSGNGYSDWRGIFQAMGTLKFNVENCLSLITGSNSGITQDKGFSELTNIEDLLYTSPLGGGSSYGGYGGYGSYGGYGGYGSYASSRLKLYGNINDGNLSFRTLLDHSGTGSDVTGTISMSIIMSHPSTVTENTVTLEIPSPTAIQSTFWHQIDPT
jgi:hypothetical protein